MEKESNYEAIKQIIEENKITFLFIKSNRCVVCDVVLAKIEKLMGNHKNIKSKLVVIEEVPEFAGQFSVYTAPTVLIFVFGKEVFRKSKFIQIDEIEKELIKWSI